MAIDVTRLPHTYISTYLIINNIEVIHRVDRRYIVVGAPGRDRIDDSLIKLPPTIFIAYYCSLWAGLSFSHVISDLGNTSIVSTLLGSYNPLSS